MSSRSTPEWIEHMRRRGFTVEPPSNAADSTIFGKGGGGHHHGGHRGGWGGTPWAGWGRYGDPYAYDVDLFDVADVEQPTYEVKEVDGKVLLMPVTVLGAVDVGAWQRQMNTLKQVPVSVARVMFKSGRDALVRANLSAMDKSLPGGGARDTVYGKLLWHAETLAKMSDPNAMYAHGDDLKKWVLAAYVEANAAEEGAAWIATAWGRMWAEIAAAIAALPVAIASKVNETAGALLGMPGWLVGTAAIGIVAALGYVFVKTKASR